MRRLTVHVVIAGVMASASLDAQSHALSVEQRAALEGGGRVLSQEQRPGSPWPAVTVRLLIDAMPEEAAAVFTDYEMHRKYIPSVKHSRISRVIDAATVEVDYVVAVPIVSDEEYTVRNRISMDSSGRYQVDWTLVRASSTKATVGHVRFAPYTSARTGKQVTLMEYYDFVTPGSRIASLGFIRNRAIREMEETARAVARQTETERHKSGAMRSRVAALRAAVGSLPR
ncbi:MAG: hypothetical protein WD825_04250 [Gemmatimonadaceae bacterium]